VRHSRCLAKNRDQRLPEWMSLARSLPQAALQTLKRVGERIVTSLVIRLEKGLYLPIELEPAPLQVHDVRAAAD